MLTKLSTCASGRSRRRLDCGNGEARKAEPKTPETFENMLDFLPDLACETGLWHRWGTSNLLALVSKKGTRAEFRP